MNQTGFYMIDVLKMFHESWLTNAHWPSWDVSTNLEYANIHIIFSIHPFTSHYNTAHILWILALSSSPGTLLIWLVWHNTNLDTFNPTLLKYVGLHFWLFQKCLNLEAIIEDIWWNNYCVEWQTSAHPAQITF